MTREEAINKLRQMSLPKETMEILEAIAPELLESEDERIRKKCMDFIRKWSSKEDREECLAYLEKQKEQKPAEWSEEDEVMLKCVMESVRTLRDADGACVGSNYDLELDWLENRFNFLRHSWKPSEEQMEALETAKRWYSDNMGCNIILESLFEQLKKL